MVNRFTHNGLDQLRKGRISIPHARYFITLCARERAPHLRNGSIPVTITQALRQLHKEAAIELICATTMPDHFHVLYRLGRKLTLAQVQGKFKTLTKGALGSEGLVWQQNYFDHRLRERVAADCFARYIFLNPYSKGLIDCGRTWPSWLYNKEHPPEFMQHLSRSRHPPAEWLAAPISAESLIASDLETDSSPENKLPR